MGIYSEYDKQMKTEAQKKWLVNKTRASSKRVGLRVQAFEKKRMKRKSGVKFKLPKFRLI